MGPLTCDNLSSADPHIPVAAGLPSVLVNGPHWLAVIKATRLAVTVSEESCRCWTLYQYSQADYTVKAWLRVCSTVLIAALCIRSIYHCGIVDGSTSVVRAAALQ